MIGDSNRFKPKVCSFQDCGRKVIAKGLCSGHYQQRAKGNELIPLKDQSVVTICSGPECDRLAAARGMCRSHYAQWKRSGKTWKFIEIPAVDPLRICAVNDCDKSAGSQYPVCYTHRSNARRYSMTDEDYFRNRNKSACAGCGKTQNLYVDHDHSCCPGTKSCGECVRGWLCATCNMGLGILQDDEEILSNLLEYLTDWKGSQNT